MLHQPVDGLCVRLFEAPEGKDRLGEEETDAEGDQCQSDVAENDPAERDQDWVKPGDPLADSG